MTDETPDIPAKRQAAPPKRRQGPPLGNRNALKTGRHTAEMKDFRRRLRTTLKRAGVAAAAGKALARAKDDESYAKAYARLLAAAAPSVVIPDAPQGRSGTYCDAIPMGPGSALAYRKLDRDCKQGRACHVEAAPAAKTGGGGYANFAPKLKNNSAL